MPDPDQRTAAAARIMKAAREPDTRVSLRDGRYPTPPTVEQVAALTKAITGREPTPEEIEETRRVLDGKRNRDSGNYA